MTSNTLISRSVPALDTITGREYRRVSLDRFGKKSSVDEQGEANARACLRHGITLGAPYEDNDRSASRYARKTRDDFARLMADLRADRFREDVLVLWESSRGSRKTGEWITLIDLCEEKGKRIFVTTHDRIYDPANGRDRKSLIEDASDSEYESYKVSTRTLRTSASEAAAGRPCGVAPHGYMPTYDERTGKLINWVENPAESMVPRELFQGLKAGKSLGSITRAFEAAGYLNRSGKPFTQQHLRTMATRHAYAGIRNHKGELHTAIWESILHDENGQGGVELFWDVQRIISDPSRKTSRNGRAVHDISMIIKCGVCDGPLNVSKDYGKNNQKPVYKCVKKSCVRIPKAETDKVVIGAMLGYLARPEVHEAIAAPASDSADVQRTRDALSQARASMDEMESATPESLAEARILARAVDALAKKITALEATERELTMPSALAGILSPGTDVHTWWTDAPVSARREVARIILAPSLLGAVRVHRAARRGGAVAPAAERIEWHRPGQPAL